jgi:hypothetical protein
MESPGVRGPPGYTRSSRNREPTGMPAPDGIGSRRGPEGQQAVDPNPTGRALGVRDACVGAKQAVGSGQSPDGRLLESNTPLGDVASPATEPGARTGAWPPPRLPRPGCRLSSAHMDWQQPAALGVVLVTSVLLLRSRFRRDPSRCASGSDCGCPGIKSGPATRRGPGLVVSGRRGENPSLRFR